MSTIMYIVSNAIHVYAIYAFMDKFLGKSKYNNIIKISSYVLYFILGTICWLYIGNQTLNIVVNILPILLIALQYYASFKKMVFAAISSCAVGMFIDWLTVFFFYDSFIAKCGFVQCVLFLIIAVLFRHFYKSNEEQPLKSRYSLFLILISFGTIAVAVLTVDENSPRAYLIAVVLLCINFLNFYIYNIEQKSLETQHRLKLIEASNRAYQSQLKIVNESQQKIKYIRHDFKKHINKLKFLNGQNDAEGIAEYLKEIELAIEVKNEYSKTGNKDVDSLMNYELSLAAEYGAEIVYEANLPTELNVSAFDITTILGNLMDNAVEALRYSEKRFLIATLSYNRGIIRIDIINSYDPDHKRKNDGAEHGIGLLSVENALQKYHGKLDIYPEAEKYHVTAAFYDRSDHFSSEH